MSSDEWFRSANWDTEAEALFWQKIKRARGNYGKSQYARIKASMLIGTGQTSLTKAGVSLLKHILENWRDDGDLASVYVELAEAYWQLGQLTEAREFFEKCLEQEKVYPNLRTHARYRYPEFIALNSLKERYNLALDLIQNALNSGGLVFTVDQFIGHAVRAIIFEKSGKRTLAQSEAKAAMELTKVKQSGLRYHQEIGLVDASRQKDILKLLKAILK